MIYRIKQFYRGLFAKVSPEDRQFLKNHLSDQEIQLFYRLRIGEQRHCLNIAYDCLSIDKNNPALLKAALLHDVGKVKSNLTLINKALAVVSEKLNLPKKVMPKFLKKALYFKTHHPKIGAEMLKEIGTETAVVLLTRYHHEDLAGKLTTDFQTEEYPGRERGKNREMGFQQDFIKTLQILQKIDKKN